jgi:hypothetical protein
MAVLQQEALDLVKAQQTAPVVAWSFGVGVVFLLLMGVVVWWRSCRKGKRKGEGVALVADSDDDQEMLDECSVTRGSDDVSEATAAAGLMDALEGSSSSSLPASPSALSTKDDTTVQSEDVEISV